MFATRFGADGPSSPAIGSRRASVDSVRWKSSSADPAAVGCVGRLSSHPHTFEKAAGVSAPAPSAPCDVSVQQPQTRDQHPDIHQQPPYKGIPPCRTPRRSRSRRSTSTTISPTNRSRGLRSTRAVRSCTVRRTTPEISRSSCELTTSPR